MQSHPRFWDDVPSLWSGDRHVARPCPHSLQAAQPCRGTWSFISSNPSVAMLPEGFFRGGLERRRTRLTLSRITWVQMGVRPRPAHR